LLSNSQPILTNRDIHRLAMFTDKDRIQSIATYSLGFSFAGIITLFLVIAFSLIPEQRPFSYDSIKMLYNDHSEFYLLNLLPVLAGLAGFYTGVKVYGRKEKTELKINSYQRTLDRTVQFVQRIENKDLNTPFVAVNGEKQLEIALESMRKSLISTARKDFERNEINRISNETNLFLQSFNDLDKLCEETIAFLVRKLDNVVQGAFYIVEGDDTGDQIIRMKASYAYNRKKHLHAEFRFAQGLVGQAAIERDSIIRTEIPEDYLTISSGLLGDRKPNCLFITPFLSNETVYGVIELASFQKFTSHQCQLIKELSNIIARTVANVKINNRTYTLLKESELMSAELRSQKKRLLQNAEALIQTQNELKNSNIKLEEQIQEVHNTSKRTNILLEKAREVISIISADRKILYVSPSIKTILGYYPEDLLGKDDTENVHPLDTDKFRQLIKDLCSFPEKEIKLQYRYFTSDGEVIWMEATGKNLLNDEVIRGFIISSSDISEQRIAIKEQRMRAKMQALSENSSDIIIRIDIFSRCTYINPVVEEYTGIKKDLYINKPLNNNGMDQSVVAVLKELLEESAKSKAKKSAEMGFPTPDGKKTMYVNAIPEFNENGDVESVLFVCHDITEAKAREELIRKKNKSISDSINYAFNIQNALMPTEENLRKVIPTSFMFYKPKDVVSGDYPWLLRNNDTIFLGSMDCTGHGVPGALMSIIGYFLQDAIISQNPEMNAGDVLNRLHLSVVEKLRQGEAESKINDGMDAAFCKINLKKKVLEFAGAHRPLYHVSKNILTEIKGDKFPVGSTQYRNRKEFTNHTIRLNSGDSVYFMTDGYPDQFGGPNGKQRFTSDQVVKLIQDNVHLSIFQMGNLFRKTYDDWKGEAHQIDDVLVIGLKF
jgi:PAS domain S-box-containing protein